jgi:hypothetical protein
MSQQTSGLRRTTSNMRCLRKRVGLEKHQIFGTELNGLIEERNGTLAA